MIAIACLALSLAAPPDPLQKWNGSPVLVVAFLGVDCPVSQLYATRLNDIAHDFGPKGVAIVGIDPNPGEGADAVAKFERDLNLAYPVIRDAGQELAGRFAITRTPELVVLGRERTILYRGRVDGQFAPGARRAHPTRHDLKIALEEILASKPVSVPQTEPAGCPLERPERPAAARITYYREVAPILNRRCVSCHQPGGIGPFSLMTAADASRRAGAVREAVADRRMPPWHADPRHGRFANDPTLTDDERRTIDEWAKFGAPTGDPKDAPPPVVLKPNGWSIREPQVVASIPQPFQVPASGIIDYQTIEVDPGFKDDVWVQEAEIRPGNRRVVHHATVYLRPPGAPSLAYQQGELQSFCLCAYAMGTPPMLLPDGMAKKVPAGWQLVFVIHYVTTGAPQTDQTKIGLRLLDAKQVRKEVATNLFISYEFTIPPHQPDFVLTQSRTFNKDVVLLALFPHMHLRGVSFQYDAKYPDGRTETLLSVPKWDIEWQHRYVFTEPKRLPAGTVLTATGRYDNSSANPNNPDPTAAVSVGPRTEDEMFNGYYDFCLADQDLTKPVWLKRPITWCIVLAACCFAGVFLRNRKRLKPVATSPS
jgi:peroxiredoxin